MVQIKICGIRTAAGLQAAVEAQADYIGLVFFDRSPRHLNAEQANSLTQEMPLSKTKVTGLFVDPDDAYLSHIVKTVPLSIIQLHGSETPQRLADIRTKFGLPVMKALKIAAPEDLIGLGSFQSAADWLLFDAKPPDTSALPGGNGQAFDWTLLRNIKFSKPWMLSGGLTVENVKSALDLLQPDAVDVSSGVEDGPGQKNPDKIRAFIQAVKQA